MSHREIWKQSNGGLYWLRFFRDAPVELCTGERVAVDIGAGVSLQNVLVTDDVERGEQFAVYTSAFPPHEHYLRPSWMWYDGRFVKVNSGKSS